MSTTVNAEARPGKGQAELDRLCVASQARKAVERHAAHPAR